MKNRVIEMYKKLVKDAGASVARAPGIPCSVHGAGAGSPCWSIRPMTWQATQALGDYPEELGPATPKRCCQCPLPLRSEFLKSYRVKDLDKSQRKNICCYSVKKGISYQSYF